MQVVAVLLNGQAKVRTLWGGVPRVRVCVVAHLYAGEREADAALLQHLGDGCIAIPAQEVVVPSRHLSGMGARLVPPVDASNLDCHVHL